PSFSAAATRLGVIAIAGTASARETRDAIEPIAKAADPFRKLLRGKLLCIAAPTRFLGHDAGYGEVKNMEVFQAAARGPFCIAFAQRVIQNERDAALGDATMGSQRMAVQRGKVVRGGCRSDARLGITDHHDVALTIDRQIECASGSGLVVNGCDTGERTCELDHGFGCSATVTIDPHKAAERTMMCDEIIRNRADDRG